MVFFLSRGIARVSKREPPRLARGHLRRKNVLVLFSFSPRDCATRATDDDRVQGPEAASMKISDVRKSAHFCPFLSLPARLSIFSLLFSRARARALSRARGSILERARADRACRVRGRCGTCRPRRRPRGRGCRARSRRGACRRRAVRRARRAPPRAAGEKSRASAKTRDFKQNKTASESERRAQKGETLEVNSRREGSRHHELATVRQSADLPPAPTDATRQSLSAGSRVTDSGTFF